MTKRRPTVMDADVRAAIRTLDTAPVLIGARAWPDAASSFNAPGLYAWWVDALGAADLSRGLARAVATGLIYAGQAGATKWPSGRVGRATLWSRITSQHLGGNIRGSTFRLTLASVLADELSLRLIGPKNIGLDGESRLSQWIRDHLAVALYAFEKRDVLADLEHRVLVELNPPLNLEGRPPSDIRTSLTRLRTRIPGT